MSGFVSNLDLLREEEIRMLDFTEQQRDALRREVGGPALFNNRVFSVAQLMEMEPYRLERLALLVLVEATSRRLGIPLPLSKDELVPETELQLAQFRTLVTLTEDLDLIQAGLNELRAHERGTLTKLAEALFDTERRCVRSTRLSRRLYVHSAPFRFHIPVDEVEKYKRSVLAHSDAGLQMLEVWRAYRELVGGNSQQKTVFY